MGAFVKKKNLIKYYDRIIIKLFAQIKDTWKKYGNVSTKAFKSSRLLKIN